MKIKMAIFAILVSLFQLTNLSAEGYQLIDLGLQKYKTSDVTSINDRGWISGVLKDGSYYYIFVLDENKNITTRYERMDTFIPLINNSNEVFGSLIETTTTGNWYHDEEV